MSTVGRLVSGELWAALARRRRLQCSQACGVWQAALASIPVSVERRVWALGVLGGLASFEPGRVFEAAGGFPSRSVGQLIKPGSSDLARWLS